MHNELLNPMQYNSRFLVKWMLAGLFAFFLVLADTAPLPAQQATTYEEAIARGNELLKAHKLYDAKAYFQMALRYRTDDAVAKKKIQEIILQLKKGESRHEIYYNIIDRADAYFDHDAFNQALKAYRSALKVIPGDTYAVNRINEIIQQQTEEKQKLASYARAMKKGDSLLTANQYQQAIDAFRQAQHFYPKKTTPPEKIKLADKMWSDFKARKAKAAIEIKQAGRYLLIRRYDEALKHYEIADSLVPGNASIAAKINELRPKAHQQAAYNAKAAEGDKLYISKNYLAAKLKYQEAEKLWPDATYPKEMIARLDDRMAEQRNNLEKNYQIAIHQADSLFGKQEMDNAKAQYHMALNLKPGATYPVRQIKAIDLFKKAQYQKLQAHYSGLIRHADSLFNKGDYLASKDDFERALQIRPNDKYPEKRLKDIEQKLAEQAALDKINAQYQALITEADQLLKDRHFDLAIKKYQQAQLLKSTENYPVDKINQIRKLIAEAQKRKELNEKYSNQIILGTRLMQDGRLADAKKAFVNARDLKPQEQLPIRKIHVIDSLVQQKIMLAKINQAYAGAMKQGDDFLAKKAYTDALGAYEKARNLKPAESLPGKKIQKIKTILAAIERARQQQQAYDESIAKADKLLKDEKYELAKSQYEKALVVKANQNYPKQKIVEINNILTRLEKEKEQRYATAVTTADSLFGNNEYRKALQQFQLAQSIKPSESYPDKKIDACKRALAQIFAQQKAAYRQAVAYADQLYAAKIYDKAIDSYHKAQKAKPDETYPAEMIQKITKYIEENAIVDIVKQPMQIKANETRRIGFAPVRIDVRKKNYVLVKAKNVDGKAFKIIFMYGKDKAKNGGFVVQVPAGKTLHDFIIRIGNQYKWFSEDNNWFSIYPENNPIQVNLVRISKAD